MTSACSIRVRGVVQGVGFRPFVYRLARANTLSGWVQNGEDGVEIYLEGSEPKLQAFVRDLRAQSPPAANIAELNICPVPALGINEFTIRDSHRNDHPTTRISPDLAICDACLTELLDPKNRRHLYPYINCTNCGPRYTVILAIPYDRPNTTMKDWPLDAYCEHEYDDALNRRFHAQPVACAACGPAYFLESCEGNVEGSDRSIKRAVELLNAGQILAVKGLGGYHLVCDARNTTAIALLRERKFRKEKPFAVMARELDIARKLVRLSPAAEKLLTSVARPIVLAPAQDALEAVAPDNDDLGVMLPYTPLHHLLFAAGAPSVLVMTSANRSSEPIAYEDEEARQRLSGIADAFLIGQRPIARRVDDSVARDTAFGPAIFRRARGYAPAAVAELPTTSPILALGADLKNSITLVVQGQAFVSQHIGDLEHYDAYRAFQETIHDLISMYGLDWRHVLVVHDAHPQYVSTVHAAQLPAGQTISVQHHRAHVASVLAERGAWDKRVLGISFDGTGYGDDSSIWGGEFFLGSLSQGFSRVAHLREASLAGGDAAAEFPAQAAAGFLAELDGLPDLTAAPFRFPARYPAALQLIQRRVRTFSTTSVGRLFDTVAALLGFTREITFEAQAAMWLEHLAGKVEPSKGYPFPFIAQELDFRPLLSAVVTDRLAGRPIPQIARSFHLAVARGLHDAALALCQSHHLDTVVLSGGVFQNQLLLEDLKSLFTQESIEIWTNHAVPPNDGGISLGQAALAACTIRGEAHA